MNYFIVKNAWKDSHRAWNVYVYYYILYTQWYLQMQILANVINRRWTTKINYFNIYRIISYNIILIKI